MPTPFRRCIYLDSSGQQCTTYFEALTNDKLCQDHREIITPSRNGNDEQKVRYIDLVNDERKYCYHFLDGTAQNQDQTLIHEFKDDSEGSVFEKIDRHIAHLEKILEDVKARLHSARAVKIEKLENLTEEQRKELRKIKVSHAVSTEGKKASQKKDALGTFVEKQGINKADLLAMDPDELIARFKANKAKKEEQNNL